MIIEVPFQDIYQLGEILKDLAKEPKKFYISVFLHQEITKEEYNLEPIWEKLDKPLIYTDYTQGDKRISLVDDPGDITERFPFGYIIFINSQFLKKFFQNCDYSPQNPYALIYALRLYALEQGTPMHHLNIPYYRIPTPSETPSHLSSFSYLLYSKDFEREVEHLFKNYLKRINAFLHGDFEIPLDFSYEKCISVIIPVRNRKKTIAHALVSVLDNDFQDYEILVVDTGSEDGTKEIVKHYARMDERVKLLELSHGNISRALNYGIMKSKGKYIIQLDSDDFIEKRALSVIWDEMEKDITYPVGISYYEVVDEHGKRIEEIPRVEHLEFDRNNILRTDGAGAIRVYNRGVFTKVGLFNERFFGDFGEDYDLILRITEKFKIKRIHKTLYYYRRHPFSTDAVIPLGKKILTKTLIRHTAIRRRQLINLMKKMAKGLPSP